MTSEPSLKPRMTEREIAVLSRHASTARGYLEFGCGGSTVVAALAGAARIDSVDSDLGWIETCKAAPEIAPLVESGRAHFHHADIGATKDWGKPRGRAAAALWPHYYLGVWSSLERMPDVALVDGRWRVACALQALLRCDADAVILFHDFWPRTGYHEVLAFVDTVERADTLAVFRRKVDIDWRRVALAVGNFALDFA
jgi:hypothetical protein